MSKLRYLMIVQCFLLFSNTCYSLNSAIGLSIVEENDDRFRPGISINFENKHIEGNLHHFSRTYGPVFDQLTLLNIGRKFKLPIQKKFFASYGASILDERTTISYEQWGDMEFNQTDQKFNLGLYLGVSWKNTFWKHWYVNVSCDSAIFPAGLVGGLLLATGRKQLISVAMGFHW